MIFSSTSKLFFVLNFILNLCLISLVSPSPHNLHPIPIPIVHEVGDVCNEIETCVEGTFCDPDGLCSCPNPSTQVFDTFRKKCVAQVFEGCRTSDECTQFASCILQWNHTLARFYGTCQCTAKYFKLPFEQICGPRSKFGEPCNEHINDINYQPCDYSQNLRCRGGQKNGYLYGNCLCENNSTYVYDENKRSCAIRAGHHCFSQRNNAANICVHGSKCLHFPKTIADKSTLGGMKKRILPSSSKISAKSVNSKETGFHASSAFISAASASSISVNSHSNSNSNPGSLRCRCDAGFLKTPDGFCRPTFGGKCDQRNACIEHAGLICSDGECQCESPLYQIYDERLSKCLCKVGSTCQGHNHGHGHIQGQIPNGSRHSCVRHAHCHIKAPAENSYDERNATSSASESEPVPASVLESGHCKCNPGFSKTFDGQCKLEFGMNCSSSTSSSSSSSSSNSSGVSSSQNSESWAWAHVECNNDAGLACQRGKCVCFDSRLVFDQETRICVNRFEEFCGIYKDEMSGVKYRVGCSKNYN